MRTSKPATTTRSTCYSVRQAACILCVDPAVVSRAIRIGTLRTAWRNGRPVVPAGELVRLLGQPRADGAQPSGGAT